MGDATTDLTGVDRLLREARRRRDEARDLDALASRAMVDALAAIPAGTRLDYVFAPAGHPVYSVIRAETGWVESDGKPADPEWVETYWSRGSLQIHRPDGGPDA